MSVLLDDLSGKSYYIKQSLEKSRIIMYESISI